ncbi:MerR family transcriptional regulator [Saccharothrix australiensis]|uniref:MerR-like DNA binding protein n=1 Tax=Saccharothrix australiensis TaxID=2072 RepID=A0A495W1M2_9PSEU|nr:MerR family transcriptional regulator [Saccharothrix australiensis]RKT55294.1 MerR-like DNA binding protein [Saccharothrix australiensis]
MDDGLWTIEQLPERVAALLAGNYDGQRSGRVRELPNGRAIRWYTTIGLVDRPTASRGRTALYGRRQLLQIVAVKRLQAAGHSLAEVQALLVGASDARLAELAGVGSRPARSEGFWGERPAAAPLPADADQPAGADPAGAGRAGAGSAGAASPADTESPADVVDPAHPTAPPRPADTVRVVPTLRLDAGVTVVLDAADRFPDAAELAGIAAAATPLLDLLARLGLASTTGEDDP